MSKIAKKLTNTPNLIEGLENDGLFQPNGKPLGDNAGRCCVGGLGELPCENAGNVEQSYGRTKSSAGRNRGINVSTGVSRISSGKLSISDFEQSKETVTENYQSFYFDGQLVRVQFDQNNEPLFHANDLCAILSYVNPHAAIAQHVDVCDLVKHEVTVSSDKPKARKSQLVNFLREPAMWSLIFGSATLAAKRVKTWVTSEVLPSIRKTGEYRAPYAVNPTDTLTAAQAEELRLALKQRCDLLPKASQAAFMIKGWSRLKAHFGVTYRQIPQSEFTEALSLVTRHASEWELLDAPEVPAATNKKYNFPKELLLQKHFCPKDESGNLLLPKLDLRTFANDKFVSPIKALLTEMHADGHNVDAAYAEFAAMQFGIKALDDQLSMLSMIGTGVGNSALKILFRK